MSSKIWNCFATFNQNDEVRLNDDLKKLLDALSSGPKICSIIWSLIWQMLYCSPLVKTDSGPKVYLSRKKKNILLSHKH